jgi:hypothetical protein
MRQFALLVAMVHVAACGGGGPAAPTLSMLEKELFQPRCNAAGCHDAGGRAGGLELTPGASYAGLVNVPARNVGAVEEGLVRVVPGDPGRSFLVAKLEAHLPVAWGVRMPIGRPPLSSEELGRVRAWIQAGADDD